MQGFIHEWKAGCRDCYHFPPLGVVHYGSEATLTWPSYVRKFRHHAESFGHDVQLRRGVTCSYLVGLAGGNDIGRLTEYLKRKCLPCCHSVMD